MIWNGHPSKMCCPWTHKQESITKFRGGNIFYGILARNRSMWRMSRFTDGGSAPMALLRTPSTLVNESVCLSVCTQTSIYEIFFSFILYYLLDHIIDDHYNWFDIIYIKKGESKNIKLFNHNEWRHNKRKKTGKIYSTGCHDEKSRH